MRINEWKRLHLVLAATVVVFAQDVTKTERDQALKNLVDSRAGVVEAVKGLSEAQLKFKPGPDRWSVAETLEHIALTEDLFVNNIRPQLESSTASISTRDAKEVDAMILTKVPDRSTKFQAPPPLVPTGRWTPQATLDHFLVSRQETISFLNSDHNLRDQVVNHPALGRLDGYQWVLAISAHSARHTKQILEVKADPNFPAK